ncbi:MAG TPA: nitronate monooxygenase [Mycobacteriales bacterium]|nr:nitronate monooxygenase [Mycobacteriales bacterium]
MRTRFTELVGCPAPIQLAPMGGGVGTPQLAAAVCEAGGLGMLSSFGPSPLDVQIVELRQRTQAPYGVGFFGFDVERRAGDLELAAAESRVVDIFWGDPHPDVVDRIHAFGALAFWQVGSAEEALAAGDAGCDAVVAQGVEAGGHVRGTTPLRELLDAVVPRLAVPVVAAGGITTHDHVRHVFDAGASAVRIGTRLLATTESAAHEHYLAALVAAGDANDTELTTAFHVGWENAPHRVLRRAIIEAESTSEPIASLELDGQQSPIGRWSAIPPSSSCRGTVTAMAMYAGAGVADITDITDVASVISRLLGASL